MSRTGKTRIERISSKVGDEANGEGLLQIWGKKDRNSETTSMYGNACDFLLD